MNNSNSLIDQIAATAAFAIAGIAIPKGETAEEKLTNFLNDTDWFKHSIIYYLDKAVEAAPNIWGVVAHDSIKKVNGTWVFVAAVEPALLAHADRLHENRDSTDVGERRGSGGVR